MKNRLFALLFSVFLFSCQSENLLDETPLLDWEIEEIILNSDAFSDLATGVIEYSRMLTEGFQGLDSDLQKSLNQQFSLYEPQDIPDALLEQTALVLGFENYFELENIYKLRIMQPRLAIMELADRYNMDNKVVSKILLENIKFDNKQNRQMASCEQNAWNNWESNVNYCYDNYYSRAEAICLVMAGRGHLQAVQNCADYGNKT